jgi:hypothetical protein
MTNELDLTTDERRALLMLHYGASGAANALCEDSATISAVANMLAALARGDVEGAKWALDALGLPGVHVDR